MATIKRCNAIYSCSSCLQHKNLIPYQLNINYFVKARRFVKASYLSLQSGKKSKDIYNEGTLNLYFVQSYLKNFSICKIEHNIADF